MVGWRWHSLNSCIFNTAIYQLDYLNQNDLLLFMNVYFLFTGGLSFGREVLRELPLSLESSPLLLEMYHFVPSKCPS